MNANSGRDYFGLNRRKQRQQKCRWIPSSIFHGRSGLLNLLLVLLFLLPLSISFAATPGTINTNFLSLADLLRKWNDVPLETVNRAAEQGDPAAQHYLGYCYAEGLRVATNPAVAINWYERAGKAGYLPSWNNLGLLYHKGKGVPQDFGKAAEFYRRAADAGLPRAQANLGFLYLEGQGVPADAAAAFHWFRLAADNGLTTGMIQVGRSYRFGQGVDADSTEAAAWFKKAAAKGDALGEFNLALLYESEGNLEQARSFYRAAADHGDSDAMISLYYIYASGKGVPADRPEGLRWLTKAAEAGSGRAQCVLGQRYEYPSWEHTPSGDRLPPPNMPEAFRWYRRAADQNWAGGQYYLALCYLAGKGVDQDEELGLEWMRKAADQVHVYGMVDLAGLYAAGIGKPRSASDYPIALLERAVTCDPEGSRDKIAEAYENLILRYEYGIGTERDTLTAVEWQCQAAVTDLGVYSLTEPNLNAAPRSRGVASHGDPIRHIIMVTIPDADGRTPEFNRLLSLYLRAAKGNAAAAAQIGDACIAGLDLPKSYTKAWLWFSLVGPTAADHLARCEKAMSADELKAAQLRLPEFRDRLRTVGRQERELK